MQSRQSHRRGAARGYLAHALDLAERHDFIVAADECYAEIFPDEAAPPPSLLEACLATGRDRFQRCIVFHSLSKRSSVPGLRSGFVAGDPALMREFLLYRTYHGGAMSPMVQMASAAAWDDDAHVRGQSPACIARNSRACCRSWHRCWTCAPRRGVLPVG